MNAATKRFAGSNPSVLDALKALISGGQAPAAELWAQLHEPRSSYLIDPVNASARYGSPAHQEVVQGGAQWEAQQGQTMVDLGAATTDLFLKTLGIDTNLSGLRNPPTAHYPIADGISYKRQFKPGNNTAGGTVVEFLNFADTPMADWDVAGPSHRDANVTVRHLGDVEELVRDYVQQNPRSLMQLYLTPGGFRAWDVGERMSAQDFQPRFQQLQVDPDYALLSTNTSGRSVNGIAIDPAGFRSRISHKPGRTDWVAQPLTTIAGTEALPDPVSRRRVVELHDNPIRQHYLGSGGASPDAMAALQQQLPAASAALQNELRRRFGI